MFSARLPSVPELLFGSSSFASIGRAIIWTSISKWGYLGCAAWAKAADSSRYPNTLFSAYRHLKDSADDKKPTIADYCLTFSTRCNASSCAISMPAEVFVLTLCSDDMLHCGPDQHQSPMFGNKNGQGRHGFRCFFRLLLKILWKWVPWNTAFSTRLQVILNGCCVGRRPLPCLPSCPPSFGT